MPINRDDIVGEVVVSGNTGRTCNHIEMFFTDDRIIRVRFDESNVTVLSDGTAYHRQRPKSLEVTLTPGTTTFDLYNRRTAAKVGQTRTYDQLTAMLMSLYLDQVARQG